jgi:phosphoglycolate phosphatase (TIGR01487 family)
LKSKTFAIDIDGTITENGGGRINLDALSALRHLQNIGHNVIFVSGRSSVEGYLLSIFGGTTNIAVGENGGCISSGPNDHILLGNKDECVEAFNFLKSEIENVHEKNVFPRLTEVVFERNFDLDVAKKLISKNNYNVELSDSQYAFHINSKSINKAVGFTKVMKMLTVSNNDVIAIGDSETDVPLFEISNISVALGNAHESVKSKASISVSGKAGDGLIEAMDYLSSQYLEM